MPEAKKFDVAVIGGGIVGCATAMALVQRHALSLVVLEAEPKLAAHQTGNNSGVVHSGLYYKPGSLKATNCVQGREALYAFCAEWGIANDRCGKVVVATSPAEVPRLDELERRGRANGLADIKRLRPEEIREHEPHCAGIDGLWVPYTGIVDFVGVTETYARIVQDNGGEVRTGARVRRFARDGAVFVLETDAGTVRCRALVNCAGLQSDRVARLCGVRPGLQIVPFRGEYYEIVPAKQHLVRNLIYPVPDPEFPFLGVHFTRMVKGGVEAGPNAVLAFKREGYTKTSFSLRDAATFGTYGGFWRMAGKYWRMSLGEFHRSFSKAAFVKALQKLLPELGFDDVHPTGAGVRAQALEPTGKLVDDFRIVEAERMVHVLNAPSPAATASISIGAAIADMARANFGLA
ncbi:MAG: L-2-hydroxyglutarate oxidase [Thermoanaerobaculaceae bacterium]|nr:L-2-hydroxyglutarate oxidase [Thermoanaerobaculaceae bacterium]MDI9622269.1 L-2-hydroxyglutarate oxidase [Acidobacteriota bacterium]HPW56321.1 L-2-hydroxyglutarate oxidase [Thermoanaerobaculaceae bacterium]